jgi:hypothetical protein
MCLQDCDRVSSKRAITYTIFTAVPEHKYLIPKIQVPTFVPNFDTVTDLAEHQNILFIQNRKI